MNGFIWELGASVFSDYDADGFLGIQIDGIGGTASSVPAYEVFAPLGFLSRPQDPDDTGAASCFYFRQGNKEGFALPTHDSRAAALIPQIKKGSSVQYAVRKGFELLSFDLHDGETGTKTVYVEYMDEGTKKAHVLTIGEDANGVPFCEFLHGDGMGLTCVDKVAMLRNAPGSVYVAVDDNGATVNGNLKVNGSISAVGDISSDGEVTANAALVPTTLSGHIHPTGIGPTSPATPGT